MKLLATLAFAVLIAAASAAPANFSEWVGHQRRPFNPDGKGPAVGLQGPYTMVTDDKILYVIESSNEALRNITLPDGVVQTMVGGPSDVNSFGQLGFWNETKLITPDTLVMSWDNTTLFVGGSHGIYQIDRATVNSSMEINSVNPVGMAIDANNTLWYGENSVSIAAQWQATNLGENRFNRHRIFGGTNGYSDGVGRAAQFAGIQDIQVHYPEPTDLTKTMLVVADGHTIRGAHTGNLSVVTIAGVPGSASFQDGPRGIGMLASPNCIHIPLRGKAKHAYVAMSSVIRRLDLVSGELTTILGKWQAAGLVYSVNPYNAAFGAVNGMVETDNTLYLSLSGFNTIAKLQLNHSQTFTMSAAVSPATGVVAVAATLAVALLL